MSSFGDIHGIDSTRFRADCLQEERRESSRQSEKKKRKFTPVPANELDHSDSPDDLSFERPQGSLDVSA
jgi:hypothetical protein